MWRAAAGGLLGAVLAADMLPGGAVFTLAGIVPWIYLAITLVLLATALLRSEISSVADWRASDGTANRNLSAVARDYFSMTKPGLNGLVLFTTWVGFWMASRGNIDWTLGAWLMLGTALVAGASSALNQVAEIDTDALMRRTANRPLPAGRIAPGGALAFGCAMAILGLLVLSMRVGLAAAALAALTLGTYLFLYTPLKRINSLSTLAGGISGALPPVLGWSAVGHAGDRGALLLFLVLFLWQMPHFLAISWKYREEYARAGYPMFSVLDPVGRATALQSLLYTVALIAVSLAAWGLRMAGPFYGVGALALGALMLWPAVKFLLLPAAATARNLFFASIIYLPLLLILMLIDKLPL
jgi:protoheme IX farnesyltransferase